MSLYFRINPSRSTPELINLSRLINTYRLRLFREINITMVTKNVQPNEVQNTNNRWPPHPVIDHPGTSIQFNFFVKKERIILTNSNILCCQIGINPEVTFVES